MIARDSRIILKLSCRTAFLVRGIIMRTS